MEIITKTINRGRAWIRKREAERKLKNSGYDDWRQYKHNRDTSVRKYADSVDEFYTEYKYVYAIKDYGHYAYQVTGDYGPNGRRYGYDDMTIWCEEHIRWNYRRDIHRVWPDSGGRMKFNDIGGSDILYFAFKNERDYLRFVLRWS